MFFLRFKQKFPLTAILILFTLGGIATATYFFIHSSQTEAVDPVTPVIADPTIKATSAFGRLEPKGEVIQVSPSLLTETAQVKKLLVEEGSRVQTNQIIAVLDTEERLLSEVAYAKQQFSVAQANLNKTLAGESTATIQAQRKDIDRLKAELEGEVRIQKANILRIKAELTNADAEYKRYQYLYQEGVISDSILDSKQLILDSAHSQLKSAQANLDRTLATRKQQIAQAKEELTEIEEVRPVDVAVTQAELASAEAQVQQAQARLKTAYVRSPQTGQVLKIHTHSGEAIQSEGIVAIGETSQMFVIAEVYESDIHSVQIGQKAKITSPSLPQDLQGEVDHIGLMVAKKDVLDTDPAADADARVIEVKIRLSPAASRAVAGLTNLQVDVVILHELS